jgi:hypothetical protein
MGADLRAATILVCVNTPRISRRHGTVRSLLCQQGVHGKSETQPRTLREAFSELTVDELKPLASLVGATATRKGDLVDLLAKALEDREKVRSLYDGRDDVGKKALQEATYDPEGTLDLFTSRILVRC